MKTILVFPCGSELGVEIHRAVGLSTHFHLIGGSSVDDHGRFVYADYIGGLPVVEDPELIEKLRVLVSERVIDALYPAMDSVIAKLKAHEERIGCRVISPPAEIAETCLSKRKTYDKLRGVIRLPRVYENPNDVDSFPVFLKPEIGYGSRGICTAYNRAQIDSHLARRPDCMILEYLPGEEYTVDCFTAGGELIFVGPRQRSRVMNGISVNTRTMELTAEFRTMAQSISVSFSMDGSWFFQVKRAANGLLTLMEVACRFAGSSSVHRAQGVNLPLLSIFNALGERVIVRPNKFDVELNRPLSLKYVVDINFDTVYVDYDDTLVVSGTVNSSLVSFLFSCINAGKKVILLSRHRGDLNESLKKHRLSGIFDEIIKVVDNERKSDRISGSAIFVDDSHKERMEVMDALGIPVFSPDSVVDLHINQNTQINSIALKSK